MIKKLTVLTASIVFCLTSNANTPKQAVSVEIDKIFSNIAIDAPGCSVGVIQHGKLIHQNGYGLANLELDVPLDGSHVHRIASVSKQFTALAVLLLADEGKIALNHDIRDYLPELREYNTKVTINAMLGHFAGMGDYDFVSELKDDKAFQLKSTMGNGFRLGNEDYLTIKEFYDYVKTLPLRHKPNEKFDYSNYAYFLLSMLVEKVSGESLRQYSEKHIFNPLGMNNTFFSDLPTEIVKNRASGYAKSDKSEYVTSMTNLFWVGDGGLHTNVTDMAIWDNYFYNPTLGKDPEALLKLFLTPNSTTIKASPDAYYANGQFIKSKDNVKVYQHSGGWLGTRTNYERIPQKRFSSVIFCNDASLDVNDYAVRIRELVLSM